MRSTHRLALVLTASLAAGACLGNKPVETAGSASASAPAANPDVESLRKATGGWKDFYVLSPDDSQTDDPNLPIKLVRITKLRKGQIGVVMSVDNRRETPFNAAEVTGSLVDGDDRAMPVLVKPAETIPPETAQKLVWIFDAKDVAKGSLELRLDVPGTKTWPVVFQKEKPPDFKPTPSPGEAPQPQGPGSLGPQGY